MADWGRIGAGVVTGGLSETGFGKKMLKGIFGGEEGTSSTNMFNDPASVSSAQHTLQQLLQSGEVSPTDLGMRESRRATEEVQKNPLLSLLFGQGGAMSRAAAEEQGLASRKFSLQPEDHEAYGQGMGNIAREFDMGEKNLASALAARGLSTSGAASRAFITSQGNKQERLGQLQRQIADDRMKMNLQRLGQTRQFLGSLGEQAGEQIQSQYGRQMQGREQAFNEAMLYLSGGQQASQNQWEQQQASQRPGLLQNLMRVGSALPQIGVGAAAGALGGPGAAQGASQAAPSPQPNYTAGRKYS